MNQEMSKQEVNAVARFSLALVNLIDKAKEVQSFAPYEGYHYIMEQVINQLTTIRKELYVGMETMEEKEND